MIIAVLSDVHSNHLALEACLNHAEARGAQGYIFLGDYISDCACPQKTMELLYGWASCHDCRFILGNREEYMLDYQDGKISGWADGSATGSLLYTYENLTEKDLGWFRTLGNCSQEGFEGAPPVLTCHGAPWQTNGTLTQGDPQTIGRLRALPGTCVLCGHTHRMGTFLVGLGQEWRKEVVRAGSVGYSLSTPGRAQMVFLHSVEDGSPRWRSEYALVPYDHHAAVRELYDCGLMERGRVWTAMVAHALLTGENIAGLLPPYAQNLYEKDCGRKASYTDIPEEYWQRAAEVYHCETL